MPNILTVYVNNQKVLEFDKSQRQPGKQRQFFDNMDLDMDDGIDINGDMMTSPDKMQRVNYVAMNLLHGIENKDQGMISATCGYLENRIPKLKQIRSLEHGEEITMDLIFN